MTEDDETASDSAADERTTAPQSPYGRRELVVGWVVFLVGAIVAFGLPLALA